MVKKGKSYLVGGAADELDHEGPPKTQLLTLRRE